MMVDSDKGRLVVSPNKDQQYPQNNNNNNHNKSEGMGIWITWFCKRRCTPMYPMISLMSEFCEDNFTGLEENSRPRKKKNGISLWSSSGVVCLTVSCYYCSISFRMQKVPLYCMYLGRHARCSLKYSGLYTTLYRHPLGILLLGLSRPTGACPRTGHGDWQKQSKSKDWIPDSWSKMTYVTRVTPCRTRHWSSNVLETTFVPLQMAKKIVERFRWTSKRARDVQTCYHPTTSEQEKTRATTAKPPPC